MISELLVDKLFVELIAAAQAVRLQQPQQASVC
jgi:hypothetical protein